MRRAFLLLSACLLCWSAPAAQKLLVLIEPQARAHLGTLFDDWLYQVRREGTFTTIVVRELPRWTGNFTNNDWTAIGVVSNAVKSASPDAIQFVGRHPGVKIGAFAPDGHNIRCAWSFQFYGMTNFTLPDSTAWGMAGTTVMESNPPGDGTPDTLVGDFSIPIAVIDFSGMTTNGNGGTFASGFLAGQGTCRTVVEKDALRQYFADDLSYRRQGYTNTGTGILYSPISNSSAVAASNTVVSWTTTGAQTNYAGGNWKMVWDQSTLGDFSPNYVTDSGNWARIFWLVSTKSYNWEGYEGKGSESGVHYPKRHLQSGLNSTSLCLVYSWSKSAFGVTPTWTVRSTDATVAAAIRSSAASQGGTIGFDVSNVWGDLTLPIPAITQPAPGRLTVTNLVVRHSP